MVLQGRDFCPSRWRNWANYMSFAQGHEAGEGQSRDSNWSPSDSLTLVNSINQHSRSVIWGNCYSLQCFCLFFGNRKDFLPQIFTVGNLVDWMTMSSVTAWFLTMWWCSVASYRHGVSHPLDQTTHQLDNTELRQLPVVQFFELRGSSLAKSVRPPAPRHSIVPPHSPALAPR